jgi:hypothetical protein
MNEAKAANQSRGSSEDPKTQRAEHDGRFLRTSAARRRLLASIKAYRLERRALENWVHCHDANATGDGQPSHPAKEESARSSDPAKERPLKVSCAAEELLDQAERAAQRWWTDLDSGYACFLAAQRIDILSFDESRVRAAARSLLEEANGDKIKGWRKAAIVCLVKDLAYEAAPAKTQDDQGTATPREKIAEDSARACKADEGRTRLQEATLLRDEASQNTYRKLVTLKWHLLVLGGVLSVTLLGLFPMVILFPLSDRFVMPFTWQALVYVVLFGLLGACTSAVWSVGRKETKAAIPTQLTQGAVVFARPLFGAAAAVALYLFVQSGLFAAGPVSINAHSTAAVLGFSFIAGFSERLVVSAVETAAPKERDTSPIGGRDTGL